MSRSRKKGPYVDEKLAEKVAKQKNTGGREPLKTWARACTVTPEFVGHTFMVHNGKQHMRVYVTEEMVGHKLGEFAPTRVFRGHSGAGGAAKPAAAAPAPAAPAAKA
ncbi:MAG TPA: 30S ribosomal protein S19 [Planctomycetota bacterium]|nr:30S ribosomal protein S19 [Planctomycetota bacterium]